MSKPFFEKLEIMRQRHADLGERLGNPETTANSELFTKLSREYAELTLIAETYQTFREQSQALHETQAMVEDPESDAEIKALAREEIEIIRANLVEMEQELKRMLLPKDPKDSKNVILEIRAGTGGDEAALFAADLFRMYGRFAELRRWRVEILSQSVTPIGGIKEMIALVSGKRVYSSLKFESGVHRVQRVPTTETGGRIHTSACTVAVLAEAEEVDLRVDEKDLRIDVFRASGPGGQSVNTTDSAIRITHLPTGLVVICQDEKSQHKNKAKALKVLKARLYDLEQKTQEEERSRERRGQVGSGDRSERIRTYNFPQGRVTDHRINLTLHRLERILEGDLDEIISSLSTHRQSELLAGLRDTA